MLKSLLNRYEWPCCMLFTLCGLSCFGGAVEGEVAPSAADTFNRVKTIYAQSRAAIESIDYDFDFEINGTTRKCRYARSGERFYESGVVVHPGGGASLPDEVAWDGQRAYHRAHLNYMARSSDRTAAMPACDTPEDAVNTYIGPALGLQVSNQQRYTLLTAAEMRVDGHDVVELTFDAPWIDGVLVCRHACDLGYWPIFAQLKRHDGRVVTSMPEVRYAKRTLDGNDLFYPVAVTLQADPQSAHGNMERWEVQEETLHVGEQLGVDRFVLTPWPSEELFDLDTKRHTDPRDRLWSPAGNVGFPWDIFIQSLQKNGVSVTNQKVDARQATGVSQVGASATRGDLPVVEKLWWLAPVGVVIAVGSLAWLVWQRRGVS